MKNRLDVEIVNRELCTSREKAKALIMSGKVYVNEQKVDKAGTQVQDTDKIHIKEDPCPYVSRGGLKLEKALATFHVDVAEKIALDIGVSSGGFTDCLLQNGALKIYAVDVGYGQIAYKLRNDDRVLLYEKTNFRYIEEELIPEIIDIVVIDVSFISIRKLVESLKRFIDDHTQMIFLLKPQFESEKKLTLKNGVITDKKLHVSILTQLIDDLKEESIFCKQLTFSPIKGAKGNIEFLGLFSTDAREQAVEYNKLIYEIVRNAHEELI